MALNRITLADLDGKGNVGLPDTPGLSTEAMQRKLDELSLDVIVPKFNGLVDALAAQTGAADIGAEGGSVQAAINALAEGKATVNALDALETRVAANESGKVDSGAFDALADRVTAAENDKAEATDLDALAARVTAAESGKADKSEVLRKGAGEAYTPTGPYDPATRKYVDDTVTSIGAGDMSRAVYDTDGDGVVDDAAALGGVAASEYVTAGTLAAAEERIASAAAAAQTTADAAQTTADGKVSKSGDTMTGNLTIDLPWGNTEINMVGQTDAVMKLQVGSGGTSSIQVQEGETSTIVFGTKNGYTTFATNSNMMPKSGGTFTGVVYANSTPRQGGNVLRGIWVADSSWKSVTTNEIQMIRK